MEYNESDYLMISGIQHFSFCKRQWALIHVEGMWNENAHTADGEIFHERAHESGFVEKRKDKLTVRCLKVFSRTLGVSGESDVVEFLKDESGITLSQYDGKWIAVPVEYKVGSSKSTDADRLQLCLQAICLEEMLGCCVQHGYLFYGKTRQREKVLISDEMREAVIKMTEEMHEYMHRGYTPKVKTGKHCNACSLRDICLPKLCREKKVSDYVHRAIYAEENDK